MEGFTPVYAKPGSPILVAGPTGCGKTRWVHRALTGRAIFQHQPQKIMYCYGVDQAFYRTMKTELGDSIDFKEGLPSVDEVANLNCEDCEDSIFNVIVLDDLMDKVVANKEMEELFTQLCHHFRISTIFISQNIYQKGAHSRTISLNCHINVLFRNARDESQAHTFARQVCPSSPRTFLEAYKDAVQRDYGYFVLDATPTTPQELRWRTNLFPGESPFNRVTTYTPLVKNDFC